MSDFHDGKRKMAMHTDRKTISKRTVDALPTPEKGEARLWDDKISGFMVRSYPTGRKVYALRYRLNGKPFIDNIGVHGSPETPDTARDKAIGMLRDVADGFRPSDAKRAAKVALSVGDLIDLYLKEGPATKPAKRQRTWVDDASNLNRHIRPQIGNETANKLTKMRAAEVIDGIRTGATAVVEKSDRKRGKAIVKGGHGVARRTRITAAAMFNWGMDHGYVKSNPFASIKMTTPPVKEKFLTSDDAKRVLKTLTDMEAAGEMSPTFGSIIRLLMLTGARKTEIMGLRWSEVDFENSMLVLPPTRTKAGGQNGIRRIKLNEPAVKILTDIKLKTQRDMKDAAAKAEPDAQSEVPVTLPLYVFPAYRGENHATGLQKPFSALMKRCGLPGFRVHDLRHTFASFAIASGESLFVVSKLLGHANTRVTERYAHLTADQLEKASGDVGRMLVPSSVA